MVEIYGDFKIGQNGSEYLENWLQQMHFGK